MTRKRSHRRQQHLFMLVLVLVSTASAEWKEEVLYNFHGAPDGATPVGGVVSDEQGNLYGAAEGGANACPTTGDCGVVYQLSLPKQKGGAWTESILYTFKGDNYGDGANPQGGVILDAEGNLYGTTAYGGGSSCTFLGTVVGCGIVYELSPPSRRGDSWTETVLYSFQGKKDGQLPVGDLVFDAAGNLYGATYFGGGHGRCDAPFHKHCGTIFELSPPTTRGGKWTEQVLYGFKGLGAGDGSLPNGGLILDSKGAIYGTTYLGGVQGPCSDETGCGIVFKLTPPGSKGGAWTKMTLHLFNGKNGFCPASGVVFDGAGNLYGTTSFGPGPYGLVFELKKPSGKVHAWEETVLYAFSGGNDGKDPIASVIFDANGNLYGTNHLGGTFSGIVFQLKAPIRQGSVWTFGILHGFTGSPDGAQPAANLIFDKAGNIYSTTQLGGTGQSCQGGCGTVFAVSP